ncbi:phosphonate ABC transporter ATP-binding protein [Marinobacter lutaoensis]|uniref:phosphonate ABC transporter ATP-binding protein n=1 Tax=Marinobacter lutaoensis TaxID=135739 RepID=UPI001593C077|nr:phosphonate ABC transporter ATP-binding protein [Marinobacter lutaoensis]MDY6816569.1 phosphonate ABC transporter ATP-binding protein [Pseudomonadota bacterium]NVD36365.1 phosphonate ABC transporter ATP-binding protein [Marinobacter lutaoensis]
MDPVIHVRNLSKTFGKSGKALHNIDLSVASGEMIGLIGPSGSGKSTLLRHISGLARGDQGDGSVRVLGRPMQSGGKLSANVRRTRARIGYIFQQFNLVNRLTVMENVLTGTLGRIPAWRGTLGYFREEEQALAMESLRRVGMERFAHQRASCLSGGQQQRVAIARALTQQPDVILADEPIASLDPESARCVMDILADINEQDGKTVVVTLHQVDYARNYCSRILALRQGEVLFDDGAEELTAALLNQIYGTTSFNEEHLPAPRNRVVRPISGLAMVQ